MHLQVIDSCLSSQDAWPSWPDRNLEQKKIALLHLVKAEHRQSAAAVNFTV